MQSKHPQLLGGSRYSKYRLHNKREANLYVGGVFLINTREHDGDCHNTISKVLIHISIYITKELIEQNIFWRSWRNNFGRFLILYQILEDIQNCFLY